jgi:predicted MFS family arabinose efflux permease
LQCRKRSVTRNGARGNVRRLTFPPPTAEFGSGSSIEAGASEIRPSAWLAAALPGFAAVFTGLGLGRFAYTPLIPYLVQDGIGPVAGGYAGAANLAGYFLGAAFAHRIGAHIGPGRAVRGALLLTVLSFLACAVPAGFAWLAFWRLVAGVTGAVLMILGASLMLSRVAPAVRGRTAGVIMTGIGLGTILASIAIGPLAGLGLRYVWLALAALALVATIGSWHAWAGGPRPGETASTEFPAVAQRFGWPVLLIVFAYGCDGAGFVPHSIFWVDYVARDLGLGPAWGSISWLGFGLGALVGPVVVGALADRLGLARTLILTFLTKALAVLLAVLTVQPLALVLSAALVGALSPGLATLISARLHELVDQRRHGKAWGIATLGFSAAQALGGLGMSSLFAATHAYAPIYGAGALLEALGLALAVAAWSVGGR